MRQMTACPSPDPTIRILHPCTLGSSPPLALSNSNLTGSFTISITALGNIKTCKLWRSNHVLALSFPVATAS